MECEVTPLLISSEPRNLVWRVKEDPSVELGQGKEGHDSAEMEPQKHSTVSDPEGTRDKSHSA